jgi:hypothetical protein
MKRVWSSNIKGNQLAEEEAARAAPGVGQGVVVMKKMSVIIWVRLNTSLMTVLAAVAQGAVGGTDLE